jgi:DNA-binding Lrp family transcriptional regulator
MSIGFFSNHAHVLAALSADPSVRMREVAVRIGITERAVQRIVADLERCGFVSRVREGRRNRYAVRREAKLLHPLERHRSAGAFLDLALGPPAVDPTPHVRARLEPARREDSFID